MENSKRKIIIIILLIVLVLYSCRNVFKEVATNTSSYQPTQETNVAPTPTPVPTIEIELSEEEFKKKCVLLYNDDFFVEKPKNGEYVKFYGFVTDRCFYENSSYMGFTIEDEAEEHDLSNHFLACAIMHEETKDDNIPSYFGESVCLMFPNEHILDIDNFSPGEYYLFYGKVIRNKNGIFIIPQYVGPDGIHKNEK